LEFYAKSKYIELNPISIDNLFECDTLTRILEFYAKSKYIEVNPISIDNLFECDEV
jgi:hypothetical protein